ncbi:hypothetical protein LSH36_541g02025 [Paralvinella palmiformis]|uniref:Uncharacterized protein n=1 Tax=Paralvinella palmiformis TaxID=53620 RepID=A0AAD9MYI2_9ANNE|nr:hypothetical protein LSH36_541g02025 [Paralvinella palmiformis]
MEPYTKMTSEIHKRWWEEGNGGKEERGCQISRIEGWIRWQR